MTTPLPPASGTTPVGRQAFLYLQASIVGTAAGFAARFPLSSLLGFETAVVLSTYIGMGIVFALSCRRAFGIRRPTVGTGLRFVLVAHVGLVTVWLVSAVTHGIFRLLLSEWFDPATAAQRLPILLVGLAAVMPQLVEAGCHAAGICAGFAVNFLGHRRYSFRNTESPAQTGSDAGIAAAFAVLIPAAYAVLYAPYGMDTTDFGYFYGHARRILLGEIPYLDFIYSKPPFSLYWHAFWLGITPDILAVLGGKLGFTAAMLGAAWLGALTLNRVFDLRNLDLPLPLLATAGFVYGVHTFPPMPWHTVDGVLFGSACLYAAACGRPGLAGLLGAATVLVKQSFLPVPLAAACLTFSLHSGRQALYLLLSTGIGVGTTLGALAVCGALQPFMEMTTGGLSAAEAVEAALLIYLRQDLTIPATALALWTICVLLRHRYGIKTPGPVPIYFVILAAWYVYTALTSREWIGFGASWPTLLLLIGTVQVMFPDRLISAPLRTELPGPAARSAPAAVARLRPSAVLGALLLLAWCTGISGGYKAPAFFGTPLIFAALLLHVRLMSFSSKSPVHTDTTPHGKAGAAAWIALACGLIMFRAGYEHPYVFPQRPMPRASLTRHAGEVFPALTGVMVDGTMYETLVEFKHLRETYGPNSKTVPAFPLAGLLTGDRPVLPAEWLQDWEIAYRTDEIYNLLVERDIIVFFERNQLDTLAPDGYARTRYTVPARIRREWTQIDETPHFVVFRNPQ